MLSNRLLCYPEDCHAIDKPASEADAWVNIALFLQANASRGRRRGDGASNSSS